MSSKNKINPKLVLKSNPDKSMPAVIYIMFTCNGNRFKFSTGKKVVPEFWDKEEPQIIISSRQTQEEQREYKRINKFLKNFRSSISDNLNSYNYCYLKEQPVEFINKIVRKTIDKFNGIEEQEEQQKLISPIDFFENYIKSLDARVVKRTGTFMKKETINNHKIVLKRYKRFISETYRADSFHIFNKWFERDLESFLLKTCKYTQNTVCATNSILKVWLKAAEEEGLISDKSFHSWKSKGQDGFHIYLNEEELKKLYTLEFTPEFRAANKIDIKSSIEQTRDLFIIGANTGLRISDLHILNESQWDITSKTLIVNTQKTQKRIEIPLTKVVIEIYKKYSGKFPRPVDKSKFNRQIQKCAKLAGITDELFIRDTKEGKNIQVKYEKWELVSSHTARRSFATNLYKKSKDALMVMSFTGHTTEENFRKYICIEQSEMLERAREYFDD